MMEEVIWCYSLKDHNTIFIFRSLPHKEIEIDLRNIFNSINEKGIKLTVNEDLLLKSLLTDYSQTHRCKTCKYLLKTQPNQRIMHKCAVTGKDVTLQMKACKEFKEN
jgi:hypothetical protein